MKWNETVASECRYGEVAEQIWGEAEIIWENSEADYQGHAAILALTADGRWWFYEWWYGSCSGCDSWEDAGLTDDQIQAEMENTAAVFQDIEVLKRFLLPPGGTGERFEAAHEALVAFVGLDSPAVDQDLSVDLNRFEFLDD